MLECETEHPEQTSVWKDLQTHLVHITGPLHDVLEGALTGDVVHQEDPLEGAERGAKTEPKHIRKIRAETRRLYHGSASQSAPVRILELRASLQLQLQRAACVSVPVRLHIPGLVCSTVW